MKNDTKTYISILHTLRHYYTRMKHYRGVLLCATLLITVSSISRSVFVPLFFKNLVDFMTETQRGENLFQEVLVFIWPIVYLVIWAFVLWQLAALILLKAYPRMRKDLDLYAFSSVHNYSYDFFSVRKSGEIMAQHQRYISSYFVILSVLIYNFWITFIWTVCVIVFVIGFKWHVLMLAALMMPVMAGVVYFLAKKKKPYDLEVASAQSETTGALSDSLSNAFTVKQFSYSNQEHKSYQDVLFRLEKSEIRRRSFLWKLSTIKGVVTVCFYLLTILASVFLWSTEVLTVGEMILAITYVSYLKEKITSLAGSAKTLLQSSYDAQEMLEILSQDPDVLDPQSPKLFPSTIETLSLQKVGHVYESTQKRVLMDITQVFQKGKKYALVGESWEGKSTMLKMFLRFLDPLEGQVCINNVSLRDFRQDDIRQNIAYVTQEPLLFHRSIADNISYGHMNASIPDIVEAAKRANIHEEIEKMPEGYKTLVGEKGARLSGGQRQRIAIARAFLGSPEIILFDEATASLDHGNARKIQESLVNLSQNKILIYVTHRIESLSFVDQVLVLKWGTLKPIK